MIKFTFKKEKGRRTVKTSWKNVYELVLEAIGCDDATMATEQQHMTAANAESWAEMLGAPGEKYDHEDFLMEVIE